MGHQQLVTNVGGVLACPFHLEEVKCEFTAKYIVGMKYHLIHVHNLDPADARCGSKHYAQKRKEQCKLCFKVPTFERVLSGKSEVQKERCSSQKGGLKEGPSTQCCPVQQGGDSLS